MTKPLILLGEAQGENEARINKSFVGASGIELLRMLSEAGVIELISADYDYLNKFYQTSDPRFVDCIWQLHPELYRTNVFQRHPPGNRLELFCGPKAEGIRGYPALLKSKYVRQEFIPELERLGDEILAVNPNLIVCLGNTALWALAGTTGITKLRGTTLISTHTALGFKLLATYHPSAVLRQWELRPTTVIDLMKAGREREYPEIRRPAREIWIEPTVEDIYEFDRVHLSHSERIAVDIETAGNQITCIGFAADTRNAIVIPFVDYSRRNRCYWPDTATEAAAWRIVSEILQRPRPPKVFQNGLYDIAFLWRSVGIRVLGAEEDTMLCHHALQPESLKSLGFLGSIYCDEGAWKHMRKTTTIKADE